MAGIFMGAMGGVGEAMGNVGSTLLKDSLASDARVQESNLALERAKTLETFKQSLQEAPLNRLGAKARDFAGQDVPQEPKKVTSLPAYQPEDTSGPASFHGDIGIVQRAISNLPEPDRTKAMEQLRQQVGQQQQSEAEAVKGKTRKRTSDEALNAAVDDAKVNDLPAYAQYEKDIGKPKRDEKRVEIQQQREDTRADLATTIEQRRADQEQRRYTVDMARLDLQQGNQDASNRKIDALIEHWERSDDTKANGKAGTPERMTSIVNAMNNSIRDLDANKPGQKASPEEKQTWQVQRSNFVAVRARAMQKLNSNFDDTDAPAASPAPPAAPASAPKPGAAASAPTLPPGWAVRVK